MMKLPQSVQTIIQTFHEHRFECFAVGGSVRDMLLNRPTKQWDFTTNATPQEIQQIFPDSFYDNQFGTVGIKIKSKDTSEVAGTQGLLRGEGNTQQSLETIDVYEITTYRSEKGYADHRHPDKIDWGKSITEDLARRDFTINAIAYDGVKLIDPYDGQKDLKKKILKCVGVPNLRFREDALRIIRAVRIASELGFVIEEKTFESIKQQVKLLQSISADRIRQELVKILGSQYPADGMMVLKNCAILKVLLPEIEACFGVAQLSPKRHHIYDVGTHLINSLKHCPSKDPVVRFATLLHDVGKPLVYRKDTVTQIITFYNHEVVGAKIAQKIAVRLNFSKADTEKIVTLVRWHQFTVDEHQNDATLRRFITRVGKENLNDILDLRIGDRLGGGAQETSWRLRLYMKRLEEVQKQPFTVADLKVDGHDVMKLFNIKPGPRVGEILDNLFNEVVANEIKNEREELLKQLNKLVIDTPLLKGEG